MLTQMRLEREHF